MHTHYVLSQNFSKAALRAVKNTLRERRAHHDALKKISRLEFSTRYHGDQHADGLLDRFGSRRFDSHGAQRLPAASIASYSLVTVAAMSSARSPGCNLKPSFNRVPQGRFRGSRLTETDMGTGYALARVLPALRVLPVLSPCSPRRRNRKAAQRGTLGENNEF